MPYPNQKYSTWIEQKSNDAKSSRAIDQPEGNIIKVLPSLFESGLLFQLIIQIVLLV